MTLTTREFWTSIHGMLLGAAFLLAYTGCAVTLWNMRSEWITSAGNAAGVRRLIVGAWSMALLAWLTVIIGTFVVYPWYRAKPPAGGAAASLAGYPKYLLMANPQTEEWHEFGMEWKEHVGWLVPMLATAVAVTATRNRRSLLQQPGVRRAMLFLMTAAFFCASIAGIFGAFINKAAPVR